MQQPQPATRSLQAPADTSPPPPPPAAAAAAVGAVTTTASSPALVAASAAGAAFPMMAPTFLASLTPAQLQEFYAFLSANQRAAAVAAQRFMLQQAQQAGVAAAPTIQPAVAMPVAPVAQAQVATARPAGKGKRAAKGEPGGASSAKKPRRTKAQTAAATAAAGAVSAPSASVAATPSVASADDAAMAAAATGTDTDDGSSQQASEAGSGKKRARTSSSTPRRGGGPDSRGGKVRKPSTSGVRGRAAAGSARARLAAAAAAAPTEADGSKRIGGTLYVPVTFVHLGAKYDPAIAAQRKSMSSGGVTAASNEETSSEPSAAAPSAAAAASASASPQKPVSPRHLVRSLARRGGGKPTLPGLDYSDAMKPYAAESASATASAAAGDPSPYAFGLGQGATPARRTSGRGRGRGRPPRRGGAGGRRSGVKQEEGVGPYAEWGSDDDAAMDIAEGETERHTSPRKPKQRKPVVKRAAPDASAAAATGGADAASAAPAPAVATVALTPSQKEEPAWTFDPSLPRTSVWSGWNRHSVLNAAALPEAYADASYVEIISGIKAWQARLRQSNSALAADMGCSDSTIYFLLTNTYKYDMSQYNIRVRHFLWRYDQWAIGRATAGEEGGVEGAIQEAMKKVNGGDAAGASAAGRSHASMAAPAAGPSAQSAAEAVLAAAAAASSATAASAAAETAPAAAASAPPPAVTAASLVYAAGISPSTWLNYLTCSLSPPERIPLDDILWPRIQEAEALVVGVAPEQIKFEDGRTVKARMKREAAALEQIVIDDENAFFNEAAGSSKGSSVRRGARGQGARLKREDAAFVGGSSRDASDADMSSDEGGGRGGAAFDDDDDDDASDDGEDDERTPRKRGGRGGRAGSSGKRGGRGGGGSASASKTPRRNRRAINVEGITCRYPIVRPRGDARVRHTWMHADKETFSHPRWNFRAENSPPLNLMDSAALLRAHVRSIGGAAMTQLTSLHFASNGREYELQPLGTLRIAEKVARGGAATAAIEGAAPMDVDEQKQSPVSSAAASHASAVVNVHQPDAFAYVVTSVSSLAWCPLGDAAHSPSDSTQYLAVALHQPHDYVHVASNDAGNGLLLFYASSLLQPSQAPRLSLALTHTHGSCIALRFYPHSLETFAPHGAAASAGAAPLQRMGVLAAIFVDGTIEVRAVPKPPQASPAGLVPTTTLCSLPGVSYRWQHCSPQCAPTPALLPGTPVAHSPSSMVWCMAAGSAFLAVGDVEGVVRVYDLSEYTRTGGVDSHVTLSLSPSQHSIVSGVAFSPTDPRMLACCTVDGRVVLFDLRTPQAPLAVVSTSTETARGIHWPRVAHPSLECVLVAQGPSIRVIPLSAHAPTVEQGKTIHSHEFLPVSSLPTHAASVVSDLAAAERESLDDELIVLTANSDGSAHIMGCNIDYGFTHVYRTAGASCSRWRVPASAGSGASSFVGSALPGALLDVSSSFPAADASTREQGLRMRSERSQPNALARYAYQGTSQQLAMDLTLPLTAASINPNVIFPRVIATAGLAGLVRVQVTPDL